MPTTEQRFELLETEVVKLRKIVVSHQTTLVEFADREDELRRGLAASCLTTEAALKEIDVRLRACVRT